MENKRAISTAFLDNLKKSRILEIVKNDRTLDIELRGDIITVYYRGCAILTVLENGKFKKNDAKYYSHCDKNGEKQYEIESFEPTNENLDQYLMHAKYAIDKFNGYVKENAETETQQLIVKENNYSSVSNDTDYFVIDIEYKTPAGKELDIVALKWESTGYDRSHPRPERMGITVFELKYGCNAIGSGTKATSKKSASISDHLNDYKQFVSDYPKEDFINDMLMVFVQKCELGLIKFGSNINVHYKDLLTKDRTIKPEFLKMALDFGYIFANYKLQSDVLRQQLDIIPKEEDFLYVESSFMGYGLYSSMMKYRKQEVLLDDILKKKQ